MDSHLSNIIAPMVRHLQKTSHGYPCDIFGVDEEEKVANWNAILEAIAVGFEAVQKMDDMPVSGNYWAASADQQQIFANGFYLFQHRFRSLWD